MKTLKLMFTTILGMAIIVPTALVPTCAAGNTDNDKWHVFSFPKPEGFDSLAEFAKANYGDGLDQTTVVPTNLDGRVGVTFWTTNQESRDFNVLFEENGATWVLMTSAPLLIGEASDSAKSVITGVTQTGSNELSASVIMAPPFSSPCFTPSNACNCVFYVRCLAPWFNPNHIDLTTFAAKRSLINSNTPGIGAVAVIQVLSGAYAIYGHVAMVIAVNRNTAGQVTTVEIAEANWNPCSFDVRIDTPANLHIVGYVTH